jgi:hypothetical protein
MNERRITLEGEDDRLVRRNQRVEIVIREAVWVLARWLQLHQIDDIDHSDLRSSQGWVSATKERLVTSSASCRRFELFASGLKSRKFRASMFSFVTSRRTRCP